MTFVDTSFWFAQARPADARHAEAAALARVAADSRLTTSTAVAGETWTLIRRRLGHVPAWAWLDRIRAETRLRVEPITPEDEAAAWAWLRIHEERAYSFVDATSFALMRRLGIADALAFDGDFAAAGFVELRP